MKYLNILSDCKKRFLIQIIWRAAFFVVINLINVWQAVNNPLVSVLVLVALIMSGALLWEGIYFYHGYANFKLAITSYRHIYDHLKEHTNEKQADEFLKGVIEHTFKKYEKYSDFQRSFDYEKLLEMSEVFSQEKGDKTFLIGLLGEDSKLDLDDLSIIRIKKSFAERMLYETFNYQMLGFYGKRYFHKMNYEIMKISYDIDDTIDDDTDKIINLKK
ncbi:hypothetical protein QRD86_00070 (plasmid) [Bacillus halotolerans]|uniref:hypothetical protein n=1 Tax=Bacillus halotolerans TaxID=260554 RepID=UPI00256FB067|nr:hypothetical protein [Bacillus halotolerans]WJE41183.1 hypothetical protein QRD86_00070 [Bacillus halotolerans]